MFFWVSWWNLIQDVNHPFVPTRRLLFAITHLSWQPSRTTLTARVLWCLLPPVPQGRTKGGIYQRSPGAFYTSGIKLSKYWSKRDAHWLRLLFQSMGADFLHRSAGSQLPITASPGVSNVCLHARTLPLNTGWGSRASVHCPLQASPVGTSLVLWLPSPDPNRGQYHCTYKIELNKPIFFVLHIFWSRIKPRKCKYNRHDLQSQDTLWGSQDGLPVDKAGNSWQTAAHTGKQVSTHS